MSKRTTAGAGNASAILSVQVAPDLDLVRHTVSEATAAPAPATPAPKNHVWITDVSGSMYDALPKMVRHLGDRVRDVVNIGDTVTAIYFSGRRECGVFIDTFEVKDLAGYTHLGDLFKKWLRCSGLTGFKRPLELLTETAAKIAKNHPGAIDVVLLSDGCETEGDRTSDILAAAKRASSHITSALVVRYGWWADEVMLGGIATALGGSMQTADDFAKYAAIFEGAVGRRGPGGGKKVAVKLDVAPVDGFAFTMDGGLVAYAADDGQVAVAEGTTALYYLATTPVGHTESTTLASIAAVAADPKQARLVLSPLLSAAYAAVALYAQRLRADTVLKVLASVGDVSLIDAFSRCFGKQALAAYYELAERAALVESHRYAKGYDPKRVPAEDAFTLLDALVLLSKDTAARIVLDHPRWKYTAISRARVDASTVLTADEEAAIRAATGDTAVSGLEWLAAVEAKIAEVRATKLPPLKFVKDAAPTGYSIGGLKFNSSRPNVSLLVSYTGTVDIAGRLTAARADLAKQIAAAQAGGDTAQAATLRTLDDQLATVPGVFASRETRQYAIIGDGIINVKVLPLIVSEATWKVLVREGLVTGPWPGASTVTPVDITSLPVINRRMVKDVSARSIFLASFALERVKAARKVFEFYLAEVFPKAERSEIAAKHGTTAAVWLKEEVGLTDGGYAPPHTTQAPATDRVVARELDVAIPGLSSLPKVVDAIAKLASGKAPLSVRLMAGALAKVEAICKREGLDHKDVTKLRAAPAAKLEHLRKVLDTETEALDTERDRLMAEMAQYAFVLIVGQKWPSEWGTNLGDIAAEQAKEAAAKAAGKDVKKRIAARGTLKLDLPVPTLDGASTTPTETEVDLRMYEVDVLL